MGIYIPGMEMPTNCCQCPVNMEICKRGYKYLLAHPELYDKRADDCPLIPVPEHGRLIDADALHEELYALEYARENEWFDGVREARGVDAARVALLDAPTIIPASGGDENE